MGDVFLDLFSNLFFLLQEVVAKNNLLRGRLFMTSAKMSKIWIPSFPYP